MADKSVRANVILEELAKAYAAYRNSRQAAITTATVARSDREKFAGLSGLAEEMLSKKEWSEWQDAHPDVRFMGMNLGTAILEALTATAVESAWSFYAAVAPAIPKPFNPWMTVDELVSVLENGGFEFRSITPAREINAALMKLDGVEKRDDMGTAKYKMSDADVAFEKVRTHFAGNAGKLQAK